MAGYMKAIVIVAAVIAIASATNLKPGTMIRPKDSVPLTVDDILDIVEGFISGVDKYSVLTHVLNTVTQSRNAKKNILALIEIIQKKQWQTSDNIFDLLSQSFTTLKTLFDLLKPTLLIPDDVKALYEKILLIDWDYVLVSILLNSPQLYMKLRDAIEQYNSQMYILCGIYCGNFVSMIFFPTKMTGEVNVIASPVEDFVKGFLEGLNEKGDFKELLKCLKDIEPIIAKVIQAVTLILKMQLQEVVKGVMILFEAVTQLIQLISPCAQGFGQLQKLLKAIIHADIIAEGLG